MHRQRKHLHRGVSGESAARRLNAAQLRHDHVHEDEIGGRPQDPYLQRPSWGRIGLDDRNGHWHNVARQPSSRSGED